MQPIDIKRNRIQFSDGQEGVFSFSPNIGLKDKLTSWVIERKFDEYVDQKYRLERHTRKRNKLYSFNHPIYNTEVILKVSKIDKNYRPLRRINLLASTFFNDYNFNAFKGSLELKNAGISCSIPIAYWTESNLLFRKKSYYMYEKIHANHSLFSFSQELLNGNNNLKNELFIQLAEKTTSIVRQIHNAGFRQGDPHPGNFLVSSPIQELKDLSKDDINQMEMFIIDLDKFIVSKPTGKIIKRFFDLRCMRRCTLGPFDQYDMLKFYLRDEYSNAWKHILSFWIHGGFNPFKWLRKPKRGQ